MALGELKFDISRLQSVEDYVDEANRLFGLHGEEIKSSVYAKLSACEGELYELFKAEYDKIIQSAFDTAKGSISVYKDNLVDSEDILTSTTNNVKNVISG